METDLARGLKVPLHIVQWWKQRYPEFNHAIQIGRWVAWYAGLRPDFDYLLPTRYTRRAMALAQTVVREKWTGRTVGGTRNRAAEIVA